MLPSKTVEDYLKAIFRAQLALDSRAGLVPMGQLASALGVTPGSATTMVKTLAESGLVRYEPYAGVRLSPAGEKLAALVVRRHRLIELFLVKVMGMGWAEVHDEAEHLEHAVSDRLIDRIDEMLGRPSADPHGDPIPDSEGLLNRPDYDTLLTCPLNAPVTIKRVSDQDSDFLRFIERHDLKPGQIVRVEERDDAADSVRLRGEGEREITIGSRAASKVLVQLQMILLCLLTAATTVRAQDQPTKTDEFQIVDNSFFVEEAFNQEPKIFQNIFGWSHQQDDWLLTFTQEWPVPGVRHQLSYTIPVSSIDGSRNVGDVFLNYRFQALQEGNGRPAFAPRFSVLLPTGHRETGGGQGGLQVNMPFSKQRHDFYFHWNAGFTLVIDRARPDLFTPAVAASAIFRLEPMVNLMLESVLTSIESESGPGQTLRTRSFTLSPGIRGGWNIGPETQIIIGAAVPVTWSAGTTVTGVFGYFSYELPFRK
jgi:DtxR family Mn-dependent transcriptional regulator